MAVAKPLTIDVKAVTVQGEGAQPGDTVGLVAQLPEQPLPVQPRAHEVRVEGADNVHSSGCSMILKPGEGRTEGRGTPQGSFWVWEARKRK